MLRRVEKRGGTVKSGRAGKKPAAEGRHGDLTHEALQEQLKHTLTTDNIPILTKLASWKYGFESPFKADVYYVVTRTFTGNKWGTSNPIMLRDADFGIVRLRAFERFHRSLLWGRWEAMTGAAIDQIEFYYSADLAPLFRRTHYLDRAASISANVRATSVPPARTRTLDGPESPDRRANAANALTADP